MTSRADTCLRRSRSASSTAVISHSSGVRDGTDCAAAAAPATTGCKAVPTAPRPRTALKSLRLMTAPRVAPVSAGRVRSSDMTCSLALTSAPKSS